MNPLYIIGAGETPCGRFADALSGLMTGQECVRGQVALRHSRYGGIPIVELATQLRGRSGARQVDPPPSLALAQNAGGFVEGDNAVAVITILERER